MDNLKDTGSIGHNTQSVDKQNKTHNTSFFMCMYLSSLVIKSNRDNIDREMDFIDKNNLPVHFICL